MPLTESGSKTKHKTTAKSKKPTKKPDDKKKQDKTGIEKLKNLEDGGDIDFETLVRDEYNRLHRQYRLMEDARRVIAEKGNNLSKKGKFLELLKREKSDILLDLTNAECPAYQQRDKNDIKTILQILQDYENCMADIENCWKNIKEMESNVDKITKRLVEQKLKVQALYGRSMTVPQSEHRQRVLENRLYHVTTQFDTKVSKNKELREEINMMLKLRGIFFERMIAMKRQSNRIKVRMGEVVYLATQAYEQRDDWVAKIHVLREKNEKDSKQHVLEIKEFNRIVHNDSKLHGFMSLKNQERLLMENNAQRSERKNQAKLAEVDGILAVYERSFRDILQMSDTDNIEAIVTNYLEHEQLNFSRFKYITDVNHEINSLRDQNISMAKEIEQLYEENQEIERARQDELNELTGIFETETAALDEVVEHWKNTENQMADVVKLLDVIFTAANCNNASIIRLLGNMNGISPRNAALCLKVIESRVVELLFEKAKFELRKLVEIDKQPLPKKIGFGQPGGLKQGKQAGGPYAPKILITGRLDGEQDVDDEDKAFLERPLFYDDMRARVLEKMATSGNDKVVINTADNSPDALDSPGSDDDDQSIASTSQMSIAIPQGIENTTESQGQGVTQEN